MDKDFDPNQLKPVFLSTRIVGFNCRVSTNLTRDGWTWEDTWEDDRTNRLPQAVELSLYLEPLEEGGDPVEIKRSVEIPVWELSK